MTGRFSTLDMAVDAAKLHNEQSPLTLPVVFDAGAFESARDDDPFDHEWATTLQ